VNVRRLVQPRVSRSPSDMETTLLFSEARELLAVDSKDPRRLDDDDLRFRPEAHEARESRRFGLDDFLLLVVDALETDEAKESRRPVTALLWPLRLVTGTPISCISCAVGGVAGWWQSSSATLLRLLRRRKLLVLPKKLSRRGAMLVLREYIVLLVWLLPSKFGADETVLRVKLRKDNQKLWPCYPAAGTVSVVACVPV